MEMRVQLKICEGCGCLGTVPRLKALFIAGNAK